MFETEHTAGSSAPASAVWARWADWDARVSSAIAEPPLAEGTVVRVKLRKGGTTTHAVTALEPGRRLVTEYRLPGARVGHERVVEPRGPGAELTHRLYVEGPFAWLWATMLGRRKMREQVASFTDAG